MTKLSADHDRSEGFKQICCILYEYCSNNWSSSVKDLESVLAYLRDLRNVSFSDLELMGFSEKFRTFLLVSTSALIVERLSDVVNFDLKEPLSCLTRLLIDCIAQCSGVCLKAVSEALRCLLTWECFPNELLQSISLPLECDKNEIRSWKDIQVDRNISLKNVNMFLCLREPSLASELWNEMSKNTSYPVNVVLTAPQSNLEVTFREARAAALRHTSKTFWHCNGFEVVLNKLEGFTARVPMDYRLIEMIQTVSSLSRTLLCSVVGGSSMGTGGTFNPLLPGYLVRVSEQNILRLVEVLIKQLRSGLISSASILLSFTLNQDVEPLLFTDLFKELESLCQTLGKLEEYDLSNRVRQLIAGQKLSMCLNVLQFVDSQEDLNASLCDNIVSVGPIDWSDPVHRWRFDNTLALGTETAVDREQSFVRISATASSLSKLMRVLFSAVSSDHLQIYSFGLTHGESLGTLPDSGVHPLSTWDNVAAHDDLQTVRTESSSFHLVTVLCGRPFLTIILSLSVKLSYTLLNLVRSIRRSKDIDDSEALSNHLNESAKEFLEILEQQLTFLNGVLLVRSRLVADGLNGNLLRQTDPDQNRIHGSFLAQLVQTQDLISSGYKELTLDNTSVFCSVDTQLSKLIYLFAVANGDVTGTALRQLGYNLNVDQSSLKSWSLWPGDRVFCLLSNHFINILRSVEVSAVAEGFVKRFWDEFLFSIKQPSLPTVLNTSNPMIDINPNLLQFACFLAGQFPNLAAKKALLSQLMICLGDLASSLPNEDTSVATYNARVNQFYRLALHSLVMLRYMLHHFYVPPSFLTHQLKPGLTLQTDESTKTQTHRISKHHNVVWQFTALVNRVYKMRQAFQPHVIDSRSPFFYDLLLPAFPEDTGSREQSSKASCNFPAVDGLAVLSLASQSIYDKLFLAPLSVLDLTLRMGRSGRSVTNGSRDLMEVLIEQSRWVPFCWYGLILSWRLLEVLPPSSEFFIGLKTLLSTTTSHGDSQSLAISSQFDSPSQLLYMTVLLDRVQGKSTSPDPRWLLDSDKPNSVRPVTQSSKTSKPARLAASNAAEQSQLKKGIQAEKQLAREIFRCICALNPTLDQPLDTDPSLIADSPSVTFSSAAAVRDLLASVRPSVVGGSLVFQLASAQMRSALSFLSSSADGHDDELVTLGQLIYWTGLARFLSDLSTHLFDSNKWVDEVGLSKLASGPNSNSSGLNAVPVRSLKHRGSNTKVVPEKTGTDVVQEKIKVTIESLDSSLKDDIGEPAHQSTSAVDSAQTSSVALTSDQLSNLRLHSLRAGQLLLFDCIRILSSLVGRIRGELGLPVLSALPNSITNTAQPYTFLCPDRLCCSPAVSSNRLASWHRNALSRRRLAVGVKLALSSYRTQLDMLRETVTDEELETDCPTPNRCFATSRGLLDRLLEQYQFVIQELSKSDSDHRDSVVGTPPELVTRSRLRQFCRLVRAISNLTCQLASLQHSVRQKQFGSTEALLSQREHAELRAALYSTAQLYLDPVCGALQINLIQSKPSGVSVAHFLASELLSATKSMPHNDKSFPVETVPSKPDVPRPFSSKRKRREQKDTMVVDALEDVFVSFAFLMAKPTDISNSVVPSRVLSFLSLESLRYLEVAIGNPRIIKRCILNQSDVNEEGIMDIRHSSDTTFPLVQLFGMVPSDSSVTESSKKDCTEVPMLNVFSSLQITCQFGLLRLMCVIALRAINSSVKTKPLFTRLFSQVCDACAFHPWLPGQGKSLLSLWLISALGNHQRATGEHLEAAELYPWMIDLINSGVMSESDFASVQTVEDSLVEYLTIGHPRGNHSMRSFIAASHNFSPKRIKQWLEKKSDIYFAFCFERFCRLLASSNVTLGSSKQSFCSHVLFEAIDVWRVPVLKICEQMQRDSSDCVTCPWLISSLRCLVLGCPSGRAHVRLLGLFGAWTEGMAAALQRLRLCATAPPSDLSQVAFCGAHFRDNLVVLSSSLCGIFEYCAIINGALNLPTKVPVKVNYLPSLSQGQNVSYSLLHCPTLSGDSVVDGGSIHSMHTFTNFYSHLQQCHLWDRNVSPIKESGINCRINHSVQKTSLRQSVPVAESSEIDEFALRCMDDSSDLDVDSCFEDHTFFSLPGPLRNDRVCSYTGSQQDYVEQHWYHCHSCKLEQSEGVCSVCAQVCHAGHDLSYSNFSTFFCDCGACKKTNPPCRALNCRIQSRNPHTFTGRFQPNHFTHFVDQEQLGTYAPWLADGHPNSSRARLAFHRVTSVLGDSEDNVGPDQSEVECPIRPNDALKPPNSKEAQNINVGAPSTCSSEPSRDADGHDIAVEIAVTSGTSVPSVIRTTDTTQALSALRRIRPVRRSGASEASRLSSECPLRRSGAVRYHLRSAEVGPDQLSESISAVTSKPPLPVPRLNCGTLPVSRPQDSAVQPSFTATSEQDSVPETSNNGIHVRISQLFRFLYVMQKDCISRSDGTRTKCFIPVENDGDPFGSVSLVSSEAAMIAHVRDQLNSDDVEKCRSKLFLLLFTSSLMPAAVQLLINSSPEFETKVGRTFPPLSYQSSEVRCDELRSQSIQRLLSDRREAPPKVRLCSNITSLVPNMPIVEEAMWRRVLRSGCEFYQTADTRTLLYLHKRISELRLPRRSFQTGGVISPVASPTGKVTEVSSDSPRDPQGAITGFPESGFETLQVGSSAPPAEPSPLLQTLVQLLTTTDSGTSRQPGSVSLISLLNDGTGGEAVRSLFPSNSALAMMELLSSRTLPQTSSAQETAAPPLLKTSSGPAINVLRFFNPSRRRYFHFLVVSGIKRGPTAEKPSFPATLAANRTLTIYALDITLGRVARCQDRAMLEFAKLRLITSLLQTRGTTPGSVESSMSGLMDTPLKSSDSGFMEPLASIITGNSDLCQPFLPLTIDLSQLPVASVAAVGFDIATISVNPVSNAIFAVCGTWDCCVLGISSCGQVCGRVSVIPKRTDRTEQLIKSIWLPDSLILLALVTTTSVQIFDVLNNPNEPKYHFKPVEGIFADATFIRLSPAKGPSPQTTESASPEWNVHLAVMTRTLGSILHHQLGPDCQFTSDPFYLAEWLDWSPEALTLDMLGRTNGSKVMPSVLQRNPETGVLGGGGVSLHFVSSLGLLMHSYRSGHSVASAIRLPELDRESTPNPSCLKITYSFLLAIGRIDASKSYSSTACVAPFELPSADSMITSLLLAAQGAATTTTLSDYGDSVVIPCLSDRDPLPPLGPITRWSEVIGEHTGIVSAVSCGTTLGKVDFKSRQHCPLLLAIEPDQVWIQPLNVPPIPMVRAVKTKTSVMKASNQDQGAPTPTNRKAEDSTASTSISIVDSACVSWCGTSKVAGRTVTFTLTNDERLIVHSTRPKTVVYDVDDASDHNLFRTAFVYPGQFWLKPELYNSDSTECATSSHCPWLGAISPLSIRSMLFSLERGGVWDMLALKHPKRPSTVKDGSKFLNGRHVLSPQRGPLPVDFFEYVKPSEEVDFGGADLLQLYNRDQLRRRLRTPGSPVTGAGSSANAQTAQKANTPSKGFAFVIEVHNQSAKTAIIGVRVGLPAATGEYATRWPKFFKVFNRIIHVTPPSPEAKARMVDIPLYCSESVLCSKMLQIYVGSSDDPEGLTSVDLVSVFTVPLMDLACKQGRLRRFSSTSAAMTSTQLTSCPPGLFTTRARTSATASSDSQGPSIAPLVDHESSRDVSTSDTVVALRLDRLFATGFVTTATHSGSDSFSSTLHLLQSPPLPTSPIILTSLIDPLGCIPIVVSRYPSSGYCEFSGLLACGHPVVDFNPLVASVSDLLTSALHAGAISMNSNDGPNTSSTGARLLLSCFEKLLSDVSITTASDQKDSSTSCAPALRLFVIKLLSRLFQKAVSAPHRNPPSSAMFSTLSHLLAVTVTLEEKSVPICGETLSELLKQIILDFVQCCVSQINAMCDGGLDDSVIALNVLTSVCQPLFSFVYHISLSNPSLLRSVRDQCCLMDVIARIIILFDRHISSGDHQSFIFANPAVISISGRTPNFIGPDGAYQTCLRRFILSFVYCLYALVTCEFCDRQLLNVTDLTTDQPRHETLAAFIINLLTHTNLMVACAARDSLARLILHSSPNCSISWSNVDRTHVYESGTTKHTKNVSKEKKAVISKPSTNIDRPVTRHSTVSSQSSQLTGTPYAVRRRPLRSAPHGSGRLRPTWMSWEDELNDVEATPQASSQLRRSFSRVTGQFDRGPSSTSILPTILDFATSWDVDPEAEDVLNFNADDLQQAILRLQGSGRLDENAEAATELEDLEAELNILRDEAVGNMDGVSSNIDVANDPEDEDDGDQEEDDDGDGQHEQDDEEESTSVNDSAATDEADDVIDVNMEDNAALNEEMAVLLAQLIAEAESRNPDENPLLGESSWPLPSRIREAQRRLHPDSADQPAVIDSQVGSTSDDEPTAVAADVARSTINPPESEDATAAVLSDPELHPIQSPRTNLDSHPTHGPGELSGDEAPNTVAQAVDFGALESAIPFLESDTQSDRWSLQDLLAHVDDDALLNYALQLSLRDQGGPGTGAQTGAEFAEVVPNDPNPTITAGLTCSDLDNQTAPPELSVEPNDNPVLVADVSAENQQSLDSLPQTGSLADTEAHSRTAQVDVKLPGAGSVDKCDSDSDAHPDSGILWHSLSMESLLSVRTSSSESSDEGDRCSRPGSLRNRTGRQQQALFFSIWLSRHLAFNWHGIIEQASFRSSLGTPVYTVQRLVPAMQFLVTLIRCLHSNLAFLESTLSPVSGSAGSSTSYLKLRTLFKVVGIAIQNLLHALIRSVQSPTEQFLKTEISEQPADSTLLASLQNVVRFSLNHSNSVTFEFLVMQLNLLCELFSRVPIVVQSTGSMATIASLADVLSFDFTADGLPNQPSVTPSSSQPSPQLSQLLNLCLATLQVIYAHIRNSTDRGPPGQNVSPFGRLKRSTPATTGLLQAALFGSASSPGLLADSGATCLASWSPLLDPQYVISHLGDPIRDMGELAMQSCLRLPRLLLILRDWHGSAAASKKLALFNTESESLWCSVLYDYLELITNPESLSFVGDDPHNGRTTDGRVVIPEVLNPSYSHSSETLARLERQVRGLLIHVVGSKHYRQLHDIHRLAHLIQRVRDICMSSVSWSLSADKSIESVLSPSTSPSATGTFVKQLRLPYISQREILHIVSSCLSIAVNRTSCWQRFCLRCPDTLIFLVHASLALDREIARNMLSLLQLAVSPMTVEAKFTGSEPTFTNTGHVCQTSSPPSSESRLALAMAERLLFSSSTEPPNSRKSRTSSGMLSHFLRAFLCHCPDPSVRNSVAHILTAMCHAVSADHQIHMLDLLSELWPDLPTFVPYSSHYVQLTTSLLISHPQWTGKVPLLDQVIRQMLRRLDALKRHPRRILYTTIMRLVEPQRDTVACQMSDNSLSSVDTLKLIRRHLENPTVSNAVAEPVLSRSWSVIPNRKAKIGQTGPASALPTSPTESHSDVSLMSLTRLGFAFEPEPCLMCHANAIDDPFFVILRWDSESYMSRLPVQMAITTLHSHYGKFIDRLKHVMSQQQQQLVQRHTLVSGPTTAAGTTTGTSTVAASPAAPLTTNVNHASEPSTPAPTAPGNSTRPHLTMPSVAVKLDVRATSTVHVFDLDTVFLISQLTVCFSLLNKRPRYVRTLNVYTSDLTDRAISRLVHESWLWHKVATVHLSPDQTTVRLCFSQPSPTPSWLGTGKDHATDDRFTSSDHLHCGLPIRASRLIFEYADFHPTGAQLKRNCPRCHCSNLSGTTCPSCHTNINECGRCRSINLGVGDVYLCSNCGSSRHGRIEFSICARPCYSAVEPLHDREDRDAACSRIVTLSKKLAKVTQNLARPVEVQVTGCLSDLVTMDAATAAAVAGISLATNQQADGKSKFPTPSLKTQSSLMADAKILLTAANSASTSLSSVHAAINRLALCVAEAQAVTLDAAAITRRLWAARQSVLEFDAEQHRTLQSAESSCAVHRNDIKSGLTTEVWSTASPSDLDDLFTPSISGCYSCLINTIHQYGRLLMAVSEHTPSTLCVDTSFADDHWLFTSNGVVSRTDNPGVSLLRQLITALVESGLNVCPQAVQADLRYLIIQLTRDCPLLISFLGDLLLNRIKQTSLIQGDQGYLLGSLVYNDVTLLQASVESIMPPQSSVFTSSHKEIPGRSQPLDQRAACWESRLRPLFHLIIDLTGCSSFALGPPVPVVQNVLVPLIELLGSLIIQQPLLRKQPSANRLSDTLSHLNTSDVKQDGCGESRCVVASSEHSSSAMISALSFSPVDFTAWLNAQVQCCYMAWSTRLTASRIVCADTVNSNSIVSTSLPAVIWKYATRWRSFASKQSKTGRAERDDHVPAKYLRITGTSSRRIPESSWITSILFSPDASSRCVHSCMDLLYALSTNFVRRHGQSSLGFDRNLISVYNARRRQVLLYLVDFCLPRLDELASSRGATPSPSTVLLSPDAAVTASIVDTGEAFVTKFRNLAIGSDVRPLEDSRTDQFDDFLCLLPSMLPFLLSKADLPGHIASLMHKLLFRMQRLESVPVRHWDELVASTMSSVSGTGALNGGSPGYTITLVAELLRVLEPLKRLSNQTKTKLFRILLHACVCLRRLVLLRTQATVHVQNVFSSMLDQLIGTSESHIREFIVTTLEVLANYPLTDHQSAFFLLQRMCAPVCPLEVDQTVFQVTLEVWREHEDYLLTRSRSELLSSDTRGLGPRIRNVIDYICTANNLTTDMDLEIVCSGQILMPRLRLSDVYTQIWCSNPNHVGMPMRLLYRIPGLESDNLPYVERLSAAQVPEEQYKHISVLASHPHGLNDLLLRMNTVRDPFQSRDLLDVAIHILKYCLKTSTCRDRLLVPELNTIPILLNVLLVCLQTVQSRVNKVPPDFHEDITGRLIQVVEPILKQADEVIQSVSPDPSSTSCGTTLPTGDLKCLLCLLSRMSEQPEAPVVGTDIARLLGLLPFGNQEKMDAVVNFLKQHLSKLEPSAKFSSNESALLSCCCSVMVFIPRNSRNGSLLRQQVVQQSGVLEAALRFLWSTVPHSVLQFDEGTTLDTSDPTIASFLAIPALPHVLQVLRACLDGDQDADCLSQPADHPSIEPNKPRVLAEELLRFFHMLESSKSAGSVALLAEDMLTEWCPEHPGKPKSTESSSSTTGTLADMIRRLRLKTSQRVRQLARNMRERQLRSLKMQLDKKGQIAVVESDRLAKLTAVVSNETGLTCAICYEGFRNAPHNALGVYVFVRQCHLEEMLTYGTESDKVWKPSTSVQQGYTTLSSFVVVHFSCHTNSLKSSSDDQWTVAQRHNRDARCNNLLPILSPLAAAISDGKHKPRKDQPQSADTVYAGHLATFMDRIMRSFNVSPGYVLALHDVKLSLIRFACNRQFHTETGGGSRESNMQLLPHLIQVSLHSLLMSSTVPQKIKELKEFLDLPETHWLSADHCWETTGPLYRIVLALHLWSCDSWCSQRPAMLLRLLCVARGRLKHAESSAEIPFNHLKPFLIFFGLVDAAYKYLFKGISLTASSSATEPSTQANSWCASLSHYISTSDEAILSAVPNMLNFYETSLLPIVSVEEFLDVVGMTADMDTRQLKSAMGFSVE